MQVKGKWVCPNYLHIVFEIFSYAPMRIDLVVWERLIFMSVFL
jgi:hypothetical protein